MAHPVARRRLHDSLRCLHDLGRVLLLVGKRLKALATAPNRLEERCEV